MEKGIKAVVLAAGKGVRMKSDLPKVLHNLAGKPLVAHVIENLKKSGIDDIILVVGYKGEEVQNTIGNSVRYVWQKEQLGTGHAVLMADSLLAGFEGKVLVACGDAPLISPESFMSLSAAMKEDDVKASVLTMVLDNPHGYGRMIKDEAGNLVRIVEEKDATEAEKQVKEVNTGTYLFESEILFDGLKKIGNNNAQGEYYLPDIIGYVKSLGYKAVTTVLADPLEGSGINSREELQKIEDLIK